MIPLTVCSGANEQTVKGTPPRLPTQKAVNPGETLLEIRISQALMQRLTNVIDYASVRAEESD